MYQVCWKGYTESDDTWEPPKALKKVQKLVNEFHKKHPKVPQPVSNVDDCSDEILFQREGINIYDEDSEDWGYRHLQPKPLIFEKTKEFVFLPKQGSEHAVGFDLAAADELIIEPGTRTMDMSHLEVDLLSKGLMSRLEL
ncbi:uncharacterized protein FIBRA_09537 [Fibroporia radiculosa]|uniref:Chromo domain-containing protein n=1 Tax=Fibroporia radiculosa TaxID=599839 RepID=J7SCI3_9APHY|nr:uncharacterized protein FIBRA_09537 [Fibroporia radiculosa]CCM07196.1 predicted protein [Fibroporia radiculosa]